jgi:hypothetical protein
MKRAALAGFLACVGCSTADPSDVKVAPSLNVATQMVNGVASTSAQDSVVMIAMKDSFCTATLIAPDLLITAHHCVAEENNADGCAPLGAQLDASVFQVKLNQPGAGSSQDFTDGATYNSDSVATGTKVWTTPTNNICSFDVALIKLDRPVPNAKISNLRFSALAKNEAVTAVGFGDDGQGNYPSARRQRSTTVLGVGPTTVQFQSTTDGTIPLSLPEGDVMTGESHCFGDSGGPLFDKDGNIVAIISRGPDDAPADVKKRGDENCIDMAESYAGIKFNEAFIRQAAKEAGHDLTAGDIGSSTPLPKSTDSTGAPATTQSSKKSTAGDDDDDDDDSTSTTSSSKKGSSYTNPAPPSACSSAPGPVRGDFGWLLVGVAVVLGARRRCTLGWNAVAPRCGSRAHRSLHAR